MSLIRCVYTSEPVFPATDQHPDAVRYHVDIYVVDAIGTPAPTLAEVQAFLHPIPTDLSNVDNLDKTLKALALLMRDYCNALKAGTYIGTGVGGAKTVPDLRADFASKYQSLP
jgi:hypothetical protein